MNNKGLEEGAVQRRIDAQAKGIPPPVAEFDLEPLLTRLAADNCEVLRARLARYEDADGNPLSALKQSSAGVDELAAFIRQINGNNRMGAGALAERIVEWQARVDAKLASLK